ncbi:1959_t:CDS:2, partial [Gigaspora rosea]
MNRLLYISNTLETNLNKRLPVNENDLLTESVIATVQKQNRAIANLVTKLQKTQKNYQAAQAKAQLLKAEKQESEKSIAAVQQR